MLFNKGVKLCGSVSRYKSKLMGGVEGKVGGAVWFSA